MIDGVSVQDWTLTYQIKFLKLYIYQTAVFLGYSIFIKDIINNRYNTRIINLV